MTRSTQRRRRAGLRSFAFAALRVPKQPLSGSASRVSGPRPPCAAGHSLSRAPSAASPGHPSGHRTPCATGNTYTASRRSNGPLLRQNDLATTEHRLGAASPRSLRVCASSGAFQRPPTAQLPTSGRTTFQGADQAQDASGVLVVELLEVFDSTFGQFNLPSHTAS